VVRAGARPNRDVGLPPFAEGCQPEAQSARLFTQPADGFGAGPVAKREVEVGRLVAEGLSNKQIGARLFISERTVATHVSNIMNKLGLNSRSQIAVWMTSPS
jgi:DNA-binding NarL/FixJ family response regulator